jgi:16S rRNA processing protein RimM
VSTPPALKPHLELGYVARAHGLHGELAIRSFDPASTTLEEVDRVILRAKDGTERELAIEALRQASKETLVVLEGVRGRAAAEALKGATVLVFREDLEPPADNEFFQGDLVGLAAFDPEGRPLGTVEALWETGPVPNLVIRQEGKEELVVPFADEFVPEVDLAQGRLVVRPPEWTE